MSKVKIAKFVYFVYNYLNWMNLAKMVFCRYG